MNEMINPDTGKPFADVDEILAYEKQYIANKRDNDKKKELSRAAVQMKNCAEKALELAEKLPENQHVSGSEIDIICKAATQFSLGQYAARQYICEFVPEKIIDFDAESGCTALTKPTFPLHSIIRLTLDILYAQSRKRLEKQRNYDAKAYSILDYEVYHAVRNTLAIVCQKRYIDVPQGQLFLIFKSFYDNPVGRLVPDNDNFESRQIINGLSQGLGFSDGAVRLGNIYAPAAKTNIPRVECTLISSQHLAYWLPYITQQTG